MREVMLTLLQLPYLRTDFDKYIDNDSDSDTECVPPLTLARGMPLYEYLYFKTSVYLYYNSP